MAGLELVKPGHDEYVLDKNILGNRNERRSTT